MRNHHNVIVSVVRARPVSRPSRPRRAARTCCRRRPRRSCSSPTAASTASARATRAAGGAASRSATSSRARTSSRRVTVLAEGTQGHLTGAAISHFGLEGRQPAGLGARREGGLEGREAARPDHPHDGLAAPEAREVRRVRRLVHLPDGRRHGLDRLRRRPRVPRRRVLRPRRAAGVQDAPARAADPRRRRADRLGGEDDHRGRLPRPADAASTRRGCCSPARAPGSSTCRRSRGSTTRSSPGKLAAEAAFARCSRGETPGRRGALASYDEELRAATSSTTCTRCGTCARPSTRASTWAARSRAR